MTTYSTHRGSGHFWAQRLTAVSLIFLGIWFLLSILMLDSLRFVIVSEWLTSPYNNIPMTLTFATTVYHSKLGVQVVIEDYVHGPVIQVLSHRLNMLAHVVLAAAGLTALVKIGLGF